MREKLIAAMADALKDVPIVTEMVRDTGLPPWPQRIPRQITLEMPIEETQWITSSVAGNELFPYQDAEFGIVRVTWHGSKPSTVSLIEMLKVAA